MEENRLQAGVEAQETLASLRPYLSRYREAAIARLIGHHREESLTDGLMRSGIATLSVLDHLEKDLAHAVRLADKDRQEMRARGRANGTEPH